MFYISTQHLPAPPWRNIYYNLHNSNTSNSCKTQKLTKRQKVTICENLNIGKNKQRNKVTKY